MDTKISKNIFIFLLIAIAFGAGFFTSERTNKQIYNSIFQIDEGLNLSLLADLWSKIDENFVFEEDINKDTMVYSAAKGFVDALGDPYTVFYDPEESKMFKDDLEGKFEGVGIQMAEKDDRIKVVSPIKNTPAEKAGILPGDFIIKVDNKDISQLTIDEVVDLIRGEKGTEVILTMERENRELEVPITRAEIVVPTTEYEVFQIGDKNIAHVSLFHFSDSIANDFKETTNNILNSNIDGIILDLRSNPGGLVDQAEKIASQFIEKDNLLLIQSDKDGYTQKSYSTGPGKLGTYPIIILINEGTASASEILTGALEAHIENLIIVGEQSFGKGLVQRVIYLDDGSTFKITTDEWSTPRYEKINEVGITPDIIVEMTEEHYLNDEDPQLDKALEEITNIINK
jgi:carboxyl-terminal processing protease